jgi:hypothetical protein
MKVAAAMKKVRSLRGHSARSFEKYGDNATHRAVHIKGALIDSITNMTAIWNVEYNF